MRYQLIAPLLFLSVISSLHAAEVITQISSDDATKKPAQTATEVTTEKTVETTASKPVEGSVSQTAETVTEVTAEKPAEIPAAASVETVVSESAEAVTLTPGETKTVKAAAPATEKIAEAVAAKPLEPQVDEFVPPASENQNIYTVWRVYNADMLRLKEDEKLVLAGIDSPEYFLNSKQYKDASRAKIELKTMRWAGKQASKYMRSLVQGRKIRVETLEEPRDSRGRLVGYAFLNNGTFVNAEMVRAGYARVTTRGDQDQYFKQLSKLQDEARENKRGLWAYGIFQKLNA